MESVRQKRRRNKAFTYGSQWTDEVGEREGRVSERDYMRRNGKEPLTNNLIRQMVKSVVGRFRTAAASNVSASEKVEAVLERNYADELDSRAMEEFLISGCCFQRVGRALWGGHPGVRIDNISPEQMVVGRLSDPRGWDCDLIGQLHDMNFCELARRLAGGSRERADRLRRVYAGNDFPGSAFHRSQVPGRLRVIELWVAEDRERLECFDRLSGQWYEMELSHSAGLVALNERRRADGKPEVDSAWALRQVWRCYWLSPDGEILAVYDSPFAHCSHPYAFKLYPLTDGEVHSLVEDVIDQQKYVNRLITMMDHIMGASAKGVLLYPDTMLPEGFSWDDVLRAWAKPGGIIPYHPRAGADYPRQISSNVTDIGAYEMLALQMKLFEQVSGVSGVLQGQSAGSGTGVKLYESRVENSTVALSDIFEAFNSFRRERNRMIAGAV